MPQLGLPEVDPRGCGGACGRRRGWEGAAGRSPRMRGSRFRGVEVLLNPGSIPAGAGEPLHYRGFASHRRVDPRGCGGATPAQSSLQALSGRSPRVRGSRIRARLRELRAGSIPAGAGEPGQQARGIFLSRVDPRGCGGAMRAGSTDPKRLGRSPRVRGSRAGDHAPGRHMGSIPAGAGEPDASRLPGRPAAVDPRGCGGATEWEERTAIPEGRSPRVRGSLAH